MKNVITKVEELKNKVEELKNIGVKFDEENIKDCLKRYELKIRIKDVINLANELGLDLKKDKTKSSVSVVVSNISDIDGCHKEALKKVYQEQTPLITETLKTTNVFKEILYTLGEAVDRTRYYQ
ncbi:MAG: hypothetical protein V7735_07775 [Photobacterium frigidiphilum]|jgi:hypothetical protein|uniref:hypothetical protein n=1 Tax=Photobacterium frigidiphilum TaxID=264736 RepID=UPI0030037790